MMVTYPVLTRCPVCDETIISKRSLVLMWTHLRRAHGILAKEVRGEKAA